MTRGPRRRTARPVGRNPLAILLGWMRAAARAGVQEPDAMALATVARSGRPSARMVLLRGVDPGGLVFYTNYRSRKGAELEANPRAAVVLYWVRLGRQARVEGRVRKISPLESDRYFAQRPRGAQIAAWASRQSRVIPSRSALLDRYRALSRRFRGRVIPRPPHWGGYRLEPRTIELWISRRHRLHERRRYRRTEHGWNVALLAP